MKVQASIRNVFQLFAFADSAHSTYAFHLYEGNNLIEKRQYGDTLEVMFPLVRAGTYRVRVFGKYPDGSIDALTSNSVRFEGFSDGVGRERKTLGLSVHGISKVTGFVAMLLAQNGKAVEIVDPSGRLSGSTFFGAPVVSEATPGFTLLADERFTSESLIENLFSLTVGRDDLIARELFGLSVMQVYQLSRSAYLEGLIEGAKFLQAYIHFRFTCRIPYTADLGRGTRVAIGGLGTVIHPASVVGENCVIGQQVTLGGRAGSGQGTPIVGDNVFIAPGAKCLGGRIGSNVVIGANAVVTQEVPDNCVVAGIPAKVISTDMEKYRFYTHGAASR